MTDHCDSLHAYVDGELGETEHAAFESHLATCTSCLAELPELLALVAALDGAAEHARGASGLGSTGPRLTVVDGGRTAAPVVAGPAPEVAGSSPPAPRADQAADQVAAPVAAPATTGAAPTSLASPRRRRSWQLAGGGLAALAAAAALWLVIPHASPPPDAERVAALDAQHSAALDAQHSAALDAALGPSRPIEARVTIPGAARFRPVDVQRSAAPAATPIRLLDLERELEQRRDWHAAAVVALLAGDREHAARAFAQAPATPEVDADRAALGLLDGSRAALERALDDADRALAARPDLPAAVWNRALVLAALDLPLAAARELDRVRALGEPGWADDAGRRAAALRQTVAARRALWKRAMESRRPLIEGTAAVPPELAQVAGYVTLALYDAVRAAPSREAVLALLPLARTLDAGYRSDRLAGYVQRIAAANFAVRRPLADGYRRLMYGAPAMTGAEIDALLRTLERGAADDIRLGALARTGRIGAQLETYRKLATATGDPWFLAIAEQETAAAERRTGNVTAAERRLRGAIEVARRERLGYRVVVLREQLVKLLEDIQHLPQAAEQASLAFRESADAGEGASEMNDLADLVAINQNRYATGLFRAYVTEQLERSQTSDDVGPSPLNEEITCATRQYAYQSLANLALEAYEPDVARDWLVRAPTCRKAYAADLMFQRAVYAADLYRLSRRTSDAELARTSLTALRGAELSSAEQAMVEYIEGNLVIDDDRAAGERHLRAAIARAGHLRDPVNYNLKARAYSFARLATRAAQAADHAQVLALLAEDLEVPAPKRCAVAVARYAERTAVAFADARGELGGRDAIDRGRDPGVAGLVPASAVERLRGCDRVVVLARAPVLGTGRLLPPELAWSYVLQGSRPAAAPAATSPAPSRLVVANPESPADLKLPPLGPYPDEAARGATVLRGADATPTRVLQAMREASVIEFHTHGIIGNDVTEPSYLVLSPELDRQYALTAADVAQVALAGAPLVILGACHAAASSRSLEGGTGLAEAFLRSGARAVVASPDAIPDLAATAFFAAVRERVERGADPAVALRDERLRRLTGSHDDAWVSGLVVFESLTASM